MDREHALENPRLANLHLETDRLLIRRFTLEDRLAYFAFLSDEESCRMDKAACFAAMDEQYMRVMERWAARLQYSIVLKATGEVVGTLRPFERSDRENTMELGYVLCPAQRRRGYATEAVCAFIRLLFDELSCDAVMAEVFPFNEPSIRLLERLGFRREGARDGLISYCMERNRYGREF